MIYLDKGEINTFVLTLSESATLTTPVWLFVFENEFNTESQPIYWVGVAPALTPMSQPKMTNKGGDTIYYDASL